MLVWTKWKREKKIYTEIYTYALCSFVTTLSIFIISNKDFYAFYENLEWHLVRIFPRIKKTTRIKTGLKMLFFLNLYLIKHIFEDIKNISFIFTIKVLL